MNSAKWTGFAIAYQCVFAYIVALIIYQLGLFFSGNGQVIGIIFAVLFIALLLVLLFRPDKRARSQEQ